MPAKKSKQLCVVGLGFIGLPSAALFARAGWQVFGVDTNSRVRTTLQNGQVLFAEPGLSELVAEQVGRSNLGVGKTPVAADVFLLALPLFGGGGAGPLEPALQGTLAALASVLRPGNLVILESTCLPGTTLNVARELGRLRPDLRVADGKDLSPQVYVAHCPERTIPGDLLRELVENDRVIGGVCPKSTECAREFYQSVVTGRCYETSADQAELVKLVENAYRDVGVAFANELSMLCAESGWDVREVIRLANRHPRVNILTPGPGAGGPCVPYCSGLLAREFPARSTLIAKAREVNQSKPGFTVMRLAAAFPDRDTKWVCFGLTFKENISDIRNSPAIEVVRGLFQLGYRNVRLVDPNVSSLAGLGGLEDCKLISVEEAMAWAQAAVLLVNHREFSGLAAASCEATLFDSSGVPLQETPKASVKRVA